jgi:hypothetical protein
VRDLKFRCSALGALMTEPRSKTAGPLSETAKTYIRRMVAEDLFGVEFEISGKPLEKGIRVEPDAIAMLNRVRGLSLAKNKERRTNDWITGECDLHDAPRRRGHDLKCPWSVQTFPLVEAACFDRDYMFQMQGYMWLWDADEWEVNYCLLDTPEDLIGFEPLQLHVVSHIPEHMRITTWTVKRDRSMEDAFAEKVAHARAYYAEIVAEFDRGHREPGAPPFVDTALTDALQASIVHGDRKPPRRADIAAGPISAPAF